MPRLGAMELVLILIIALVVFGPSKLPEIGKSIGQSINEFKKGMNEISKDTDINKEDKKDEEVKDDSVK